MKFAYYQRLGRKDRAIYDRSDSIREVRLPDAPALRDVVGVVKAGLQADDRIVVEAAAGKLALGITQLLEVEPVVVTVLPVRPALRGGELHGLYTRDGRSRPRIRVWMRTVRHKRVVAFKTFLRTLLTRWSTTSTSRCGRCPSPSTRRASSAASPACSTSWCRRRRGHCPWR